MEVVQTSLVAVFASSTKQAFISLDVVTFCEKQANPHKCALL